MLCKTHKKTKLIALVLAGLIFLNVNFVSAAVNLTLKDALLPFVDIKYDYANGVIDEVIIYNRALSSGELNAIYSSSPQGMGEMWNCTLKAIDSTGAEGINSKVITMPGYALPNITSITITPSPAYDDSELNCSAIYGNPDGNKGNVSISWYNGSALFLQTTQYNKFSGESVNEPLTWVDRNGLIAYYKFAEGNGTQTRDISGNENNGTLVNSPTWVDGKYGKALQFDGTNYVDIDGNGILNITGNQITQEAWIYPTGDVNQGTIATKPWAYYFQRHSDGKLYTYQYGTSPSGYHASTGTAPLNQWSHVAYTYNGSILTFYINGVASGSVSKTGSITPAVGYEDKSFRIGAEAYGETRYFKGFIDEVRIYNRSLTSGEISEIYSASPHAKGETWNCTINATDSQGDMGLPSSTTITIGSQSAQNYTPKWVHITVTYNKATRQKKIYVNGNLTRTETLQGLSDYKINNQTGDLYAGKLYGLPAGNPFNGSIDNILISQKEKSAAEIWQDYLNNIIYSKMPGPNEAKTMAIEGENITEISIAPIVKVSNKEKTCDVTSKVKLPECVQ